VGGHDDQGRVIVVDDPNARGDETVVDARVDARVDGSAHAEHHLFARRSVVVAQRRRDRGEEFRRLRCGCAHGARDPDGVFGGQSLLEHGQQAGVPGLVGLDHRDGVGSELHRRRGAPQRRVSGVQAQRHAPILHEEAERHRSLSTRLPTRVAARRVGRRGQTGRAGPCASPSDSSPSDSSPGAASSPGVVPSAVGPGDASSPD